MSIWPIILEAGPVVKLVMFLLILLSVISWAIFLKKKIYFKKMTDHNQLFLSFYNDGSSFKEIMEKSLDYPYSPYSTIFERGYGELKKIKDAKEGKTKELLNNHFSKFGFNLIERAITQAINECNHKIETLISILASIGSISPFIGLFGTVWGIINSFTGFATEGTTLDAVAPGIAEALIATALGLAVAIPAVWFYNHFQNELVKINRQMESFSQEFLNMVERSIMDD